MNTAPAPRLTAGVVASVVLHGGLVAAFLLMRSPAAPPSAPMIMVRMFAAPAGDRAIGAVQETPSAPPAPTVTPPKPVTTKAAAPTAKPKPAPRAATPSGPPKTAEKPAASPQKAGGGETGGRGADVANVDTPGIEFDYPGYTTNIVRQLIMRFGTLSGSLEAEVRFVIHRDGSVDPSSIKLVTPSGNYSFDQRALSTVESAANARAFGPLPPGFNEDILPVTFRFSPKIIK